MKVTVFSQTSIDGKLTLGAGNSSKALFDMLSEDDFRFIHKFRGEVDGIMVGRNTVVTDDPSLTNRYEENRNPVRIVPSSTLDFPLSAKILSSPEPTIIVTTERARNSLMVGKIEEAGKRVLICGEEQVEFERLFDQLKSMGMKHIMVEGGGFLNWQAFNTGMVHEIILMQLPIIIGGASNITLADGLGYQELEATQKYKIVEMDNRENYTLLRFHSRHAA